MIEGRTCGRITQAILYLFDTRTILLMMFDNSFLESMSAQEMNKNEETGFGDEFKKVESRKRKADEKMDDRPYFEPIAADKMGSKKKGAPDVRRGMSTLGM